MSLEVVSRQFPLVGRAAGLLISGLALVLAAMVAMPVSHSDNVSRDGVDTVYPLMLLPSIAVVAAAGISALLRPAIAQAASVVSGIFGIQVLGIAVVALADWRNYAGTGGTSWERGDVASLVAIGMFFAALIVILVSCALYRNIGPRAGEVPAVHPVYLIAALAVAAGLPVVLGWTLHHLTPTAAGQFALWWSAPWGVGIIAAGGTRVSGCPGERLGLRGFHVRLCSGGAHARLRTTTSRRLNRRLCRT
jgi:hypothetical protein